MMPDDMYREEEERIINDPTLTEKERQDALRRLYWEAQEEG